MPLSPTPLNIVSGLEQMVQSVNAFSGCPQTATSTIFTVVGAVEVLEIFGVITTAASATATNLKISAKVGTLTAVDICANGLITSLAAGQLLCPKTSFATALTVASPTTLGVMDHTSAVATSFAMSGSGVITVTTDASNTTAVIQWYCRYKPMSPGAYIQ